MSRLLIHPADSSHLPRNLENSLPATSLHILLPPWKWKGVKSDKKCLAMHCLCVLHLRVCVERKREGEMRERLWQRRRMRQRKRWDLWSHLFTRGLSPERPFTVVNHLHGDILKLRWMGGSDAFQTCLWYTLREIVDGSLSPCVGPDYSPKAKEHSGLL